MLIIWDEMPMTKKTVFDAVDCSLRDIRSHLPGGTSAFGGIPVILVGDFQQTLPVIPHGDRSRTVFASLQYAKIWPHLNHIFLHENMRLATHQDPANLNFAAWLARMSYDENLIGDITLPKS